MLQMDTGTFASLLFTVGSVGIALGVFGSVVWRDAKKRGKAQIAWYDPDAGSFKISYHKLEGNEFTVGRGEKARRYIVAAAARLYPSTWIVNPRTGWNYQAPSDAETVNGNALLMRLAVSNPGAYHLAISRNRARDSLNANTKDDKWGWVMPVALVAGMAIVATLVTVGFIAIKIAGAGVPAAGV